jgi:cell volume regulation protein A
MELGNQLILLGAGLIFVSIFAGLISSRIGAPLLLVFLALGMLAGEDGLGGIHFDNFQAAYTIGATALAIVLFDGGLRTHRDTLRLASWPALVLATVGVIATAALTGVAAFFLIDLNWLQSLLVGSVVASTDAAAVFFLLNLRGTNLVKRVSATLEAESGLNDPMAVFLTVTCVELLALGVPEASWSAALDLGAVFVLQIAGGAAFGLVGGYALLRLVNVLQLATGLYPILALSGALVIFAGAQNVGASGFLAAYLAGIVLGNQRHRATQIIDRFQDGLAWLSQIVMFLMLGLLVTPSQLADSLLPALAIAAFLMLVARPLSVAACLLPFRFTWRERGFVAWVGLRGAVPIFLGTVPVLAGLPNAALYLEVAFVEVLTALIVQGWTLNWAARGLNLALPPPPDPSQRVDVDLPADVGRDMAAYTVQDGSAAAGRHLNDLPIGADIDVVSVIRDGAMRRPGTVGRLSPGDYVVVVVPAERLEELDKVFGRPPKRDRRGRDEAVLGEFAFGGEVKVGDLVAMYDLAVPTAEHDLSADTFLRRHLRGQPVTGDRLRLGPVELIVRKLDGERIKQVGIELDPQPVPIRKDLLFIWVRHALRRLRGVFRRGG